jgi:hypothetical protein
MCVIWYTGTLCPARRLPLSNRNRGSKLSIPRAHGKKPTGKGDYIILCGWIQEKLQKIPRPPCRGFLITWRSVGS